MRRRRRVNSRCTLIANAIAQRCAFLIHGLFWRRINAQLRCFAVELVVKLLFLKIYFGRGFFNRLSGWLNLPSRNSPTALATAFATLLTSS